LWNESFFSAPQLKRDSLDSYAFPMPARFLVEDTFRLSNRGVFVVHGRIVEGAIRPGQRVRAPSQLDAPVDGVEFVLLSASDGCENPALTFRYSDEAQLARWQALQLAGQIVELEDADVPGERGRAAV